MLQERVEFVVEICADGHVGEHSVEFAGEFVAAGLLQAVYHGFFGVHALGLLVDEAFGEHSGVEFLENVFVVDVLEDCYAFGEFFVHLGKIDRFLDDCDL